MDCPTGEPGPVGEPGRRRIPVLCLGRDALPPGAVYAGRPGPLGNPYMIGVDGDRDEVVRLFRIYFRQRLELDPNFKKYVRSLRDIPALYCHCRKPLPCHAEVIAQHLEQHS